MQVNNSHVISNFSQQLCVMYCGLVCETKGCSAKKKDIF